MESVDTGASLEGTASEVESAEFESADETIAQPKEEKPKARYKVKVDQEEMEVDEDELKRGYAHNKAAAKRMEEAAEMRKSYQRQIQIADGFEKWIDNVKTNPMALFALGEQLGLDLDDLAMRRAAERLKYEYMDENERRAYDNERELSRYKQAEARQQEEQRQKAQQEYLAKARETVESEFVEFFTTNKIQPTPSMLSRIAEIKYGAASAGKPISVEQAYQRVAKEMQLARLDLIANLTEDDIKALPKEKLQKLRQVDMRAFNEGRRPTAQAASTPQVKKPMSTDDFFAMKDKQFSKRK
jgi:hypothetical protein